MDREAVLAHVLDLVVQQRTDEAIAVAGRHSAERGLLAFALAIGGDHERAAAVLQDSPPTARPAGMEDALTAVVAELVSAARGDGFLGPRPPLAPAILQITPQDRWTDFVRYLAVEASLAAARLDEADALHPGTPLDELWRGHPFAGVMRACDARVSLFGGRVAEARGLLDTGMPGDLAGHMLRATSALIAGSADDIDGLRREEEAVLAAGIRTDDYIGSGIFLLLAYARLAVHDVPAAVAHLMRAGGGDPDLAGLTLVDRALALETFFAAAFEEGDAPAALSWLARAEPLAGHRAAAPTVLRMTARYAALGGDPATAQALAVRAVDLARVEHRRIEQVWGELILAEAQIAGRHGLDAAHLLRDRIAQTDAEGHQGARRFASRILRRAGKRLPPRSGAQGAALTDRERAVADLMLAGLSNAEIADRLVLSPRTVGSHVTRVLAAFGVATRIGLLASLHEAPASPRIPPDLRLTPRQAQILALLAQAKSNKQIAAEMNVTVKTVENHVSAILAACGAATRFDLASAWWEAQER